MAFFALATMALLASFVAPAGAIVGGRNDTFPWAVAFIRPDNGTDVEERLVCSGVLIKPQWVLTAAHCGIGLNDTVTIGRGRLASTGGERRSIAFTRVQDDVLIPTIHRMRNDSTYCPFSDSERRAELCDIALVKLSEPATQPDLDLADAQVLAEWNEGSVVRAYGYGAESLETRDRSSGHLKRGQMQIDEFRQNHYTMWASGHGEGTALCFGDSGGPLLVSTSLGTRIVGVNRATSACSPDGTNYFVKVGSRGSPANSQPFLWITNTI